MAVHPSACFFDCPDACGIRVETDAAGQFVALRGNPAHPWSAGVLCTKTSQYGDLVRDEQRIVTPWIRDRSGRLQQATWEQALERIVEALAPLAPERILSLDYAGNMGVLGRRFPKRILNALGATLNDGGICDAAAEAGFEAVLGRAIGFDLEHLETCDGIVIWGCDVARTMSHLMPRLARAVKAGAWVAVVDIYESDTVAWVRKHGGTALLLRPGTDAALALGLCQLAFEERRADLGFLKHACVGSAEFRAHLAGRYGVEEVSAVTGIEPAELRAFAQRFHASKAPLLKLGIGMSRRAVGGMSMRALASYAAVLGIADRTHWESGAHFGLDLAELDGHDLRPAGFDQPPIRLVQLGNELASGRFGASLVWGHNPAVTVPDSNMVRRGLADPNHFLMVHELVWTATAQLADVVLPATTFLDQADLLRSYGHRVLHYVPKVLDPIGETRGNVAAFAAIGEALGLDRSVWEGSPETWCERVLNNNRTRFTDEEWQRLLAHEPVKLAAQVHADRGTSTGRIELFSAQLELAGHAPMAEYTPDEG
ncbi:MAG TPA: molybdopterin-dependent oxidoreductase, partial [Planctomycetota bacterium]|nr:molybdopterin-dependent oxidoreductase [Planctomycetota bacterium]